MFLFMVLPTFITGGILHFFPGFPMWGRNLVEGILKIAIFMLYLIFCSKQKDIYRVFQYHGAEHKTIFCYEEVCRVLDEKVASEGGIPTVEEVQDTVEKVLVEKGHAKTAKAYILYRANRTPKFVR